MNRFLWCLFLISTSTLNYSFDKPYPYAGVNFGMIESNTKTKQGLYWSNTVGTTTNYYNKTGVVGDIQAGFIQNIDKLSLGLSAAYNYTDITAQAGSNAIYNNINFYDDFSVNLNYFYSFIVQPGYWLTDSSNIFFDVGAALARYTFTQAFKNTLSPQEYQISKTKNLWGLDLGLGFKHKITPAFNLVLLGQYINFNNYYQNKIHSTVYGTEQDIIKAFPEIMMAKIGFEYRFFA